MGVSDHQTKLELMNGRLEGHAHMVGELNRLGVLRPTDAQSASSPPDPFCLADSALGVEVRGCVLRLDLSESKLDKLAAEVQDLRAETSFSPQIAALIEQLSQVAPMVSDHEMSLRSLDSKVGNAHAKLEPLLELPVQMARLKSVVDEVQEGTTAQLASIVPKVGAVELTVQDLRKELGDACQQVVGQDAVIAKLQGTGGGTELGSQMSALVRQLSELAGIVHSVEESIESMKRGSNNDCHAYSPGAPASADLALEVAALVEQLNQLGPKVLHQEGVLTQLHDKVLRSEAMMRRHLLKS